jgi:hypothetical protein
MSDEPFLCATLKQRPRDLIVRRFREDAPPRRDAAGARAVAGFQIDEALSRAIARKTNPQILPILTET